MVTSIAEHALTFITDGNVVGLGSGRASRNFVRALGARVQAGLQIQGIPTSRTTADLAKSLRIPLTTLNDVDRVDIAIDGADEVDPALHLIKGYGGALVREKIVAASAERFVILVGTEKLVPVLGSRGKLPIEILPFGVALCLCQLHKFDWQPQLREENGSPFATDNDNYIIDCSIPALPSPAAWEHKLLAVPGVVGTGLFVDMADTILIQDGERVRVRERSRNV